MPGEARLRAELAEVARGQATRSQSATEAKDHSQVRGTTVVVYCITYRLGSAHGNAHFYFVTALTLSLTTL